MVEAILAFAILASVFLAIFGGIIVYCYLNALNMNRPSKRVQPESTN